MRSLGQSSIDCPNAMLQLTVVGQKLVYGICPIDGPEYCFSDCYGSHFIRNDAILGKFGLQILCSKRCPKNKQDKQDSCIFHLGLRHTDYASLSYRQRQ